MKSLIMILALVMILTPLGACEEMMENIGPGPVTVNLGDGYQASFVMPDTGEAYDIEVTDPSILDFVAKGTRYEMYIYPASGEDSLVNLFLTAYSEPWLSPIPKDSRTDPTGSMIGPRVEKAQTIDGWRGYIGYDWPAGNPGTDPSEAMWEFFDFYPNAWEADGSLESYIVVNGESAVFQEYPNAMPVIQSIIDTIHVSGPGI